MEIASYTDTVVPYGTKRKMNDDFDGFETYHYSAWFAAIRAADTWRASSSDPKRTGDLSQLATQLSLRLSDAPDGIILTKDESELLVDLLGRHRLKQKPGGRKLPAYKLASSTDLKLEFAAENVRYYRSKGLSFDEAVERVVRFVYVPKDSLRLFLKGRLHHDRRKKASATTKPAPKAVR